MAQSDLEPPPHAFPSWPFSCMAFYTHMARDYARYAKTLTEATDAAHALRAESDFGASLFHDLMQAYYELAMAPFVAATKAYTEQNSPSAARPAAKAKTAAQG